MVCVMTVDLHRSSAYLNVTFCKMWNNSEFILDCGRRNVNPRPFIINGVRTNSSSWPWHAALFRRQGRSIRYICGGSIISKSAVLTAAHCVAAWGGNELLPNSTVVLVGDVLSNFTEIPHSNTKVQVLNVSEIIYHQVIQTKLIWWVDKRF